MEKEHKIKIIERYDGYFSGINNKGAFILALNTLIISGFLIGIKDMKSLVSCCESFLFDITVGITILFSIISMLFTISAIIPYLDSNKKSFWFFNDVANRTIVDFTAEIDKQDEEALNTDINEQIYYLAIGLRKKHSKIRISLVFNFMQMFLIGIIALIILT